MRPQPAAPAADPAPTRTERFHAALDELVDIGMDLVRDLHAEAKSNEPGTISTADAIVAYDRAARAIRRTIHLAQRLDEPPRLSEPARAAARKRIIREVEDSIERNSRPTDAPVLRAELNERLDQPDLEDELDTRPIPEIIADICRDLGLANTAGERFYKRRSPDEVAELCARAAQAAEPPTAGRSDPERQFHQTAAPDRPRRPEAAA